MSAGAQENPLFFGEWRIGAVRMSEGLEPSYDYVMRVSPGKTQSYIEGKQISETRFIIIHEMQDKMIVWYKYRDPNDEDLAEGEWREEGLTVYRLSDWSEFRPGLIVLWDDGCSDSGVGDYILGAGEPDKIWQKLLEWSDESHPDAENRLCRVSEDMVMQEGRGGTPLGRMLKPREIPPENR